MFKPPTNISTWTENEQGEFPFVIISLWHYSMPGVYDNVYFSSL